MAANFWTSSHYKQLMEQEEVDVVHPLDKERGISVEDFKLIKFHMSNHMIKLAQHIKVRQRVVATAVTYMRRVYTRKSMVEFEPRLVALACMYLASKAEESIVQARNIIFYIRKLYPDEYKYELKDVLGMEMKVLEALNYYLVVFLIGTSIHMRGEGSRRMEVRSSIRKLEACEVTKKIEELKFIKEA